MAINYDNTMPEWKNEGIQPSDELREKGFTGGYKPPATVFNWFWCRVQKCITELQSKFSTIEDKKLDKSGGIVTGDLNVNGDLTVRGMSIDELNKHCYVVAAYNSSPEHKKYANFVLPEAGETSGAFTNYLKSLPTGSSVYCMPGDYNVSCTIDLPDYITITGAGLATTFVATGASYIFKAVDANYININNITLKKSPTGNYRGSLLNFDNCSNVRLSCINFIYLIDSTIDLTGINNCAISIIGDAVNYFVDRCIFKTNCCDLGSDSFYSVEISANDNEDVNSIVFGANLCNIYTSINIINGGEGEFYYAEYGNSNFRLYKDGIKQ